MPRHFGKKTDVNGNAATPSLVYPRKRIIVACDGTWMDSDGTTRIPSNITRIVRAIPSIGYESDGKAITQVTFYQNGIGTGSGGFYSQYIGKYVSGATGEGLDYNIREAYQFICSNYTPGDEIILLGFSRGAFTARSISTLIKQCGLLTARGLNHLVEIADDWEHQQNPNYSTPYPDQPWAGLRFSEPAYQAKLLELGMTRPDIPVKCVAVWDTVGALGLPSIAIMPERRAQEFAFVDTRVEDNIEYAFHALGLDEKRRAYAPTVWYKPDSQTFPKVLKQTWFREYLRRVSKRKANFSPAGVHSDIGGSYANDDIANITLAWMVGQLEDHQLITFNRDYILNMVQKTIQRHAIETEKMSAIGPGSLVRAATMGPLRKWGLGKIHDSYSLFFRFGGSTTRSPREHPEYSRTTKKPTGKYLKGTHERMHASVRVRMALNGKGYDDQGDYVSDALKGWQYTFGSLAQPDTPWQKTQPGEVGRLKDVVWHKTIDGEDGKEGEKVTMVEDTMTDFERLVLRHWTGAEDDWEDGADEREWEIDTARPIRRESHKNLESASAAKKIAAENGTARRRTKVTAIDEGDEDDDASRQLRLETNLHR